MFDLRRILQIAELYPDEVRVYPLGAKDEQGRTNLQGLARQNAKRDAYAQVSIEDRWVKGLADRDESKRPLVFMVCIPRELVDVGTGALEIPGLGEQRSSGGLILPGAP